MSDVEDFDDLVERLRERAAKLCRAG